MDALLCCYCSNIDFICTEFVVGLCFYYKRLVFYSSYFINILLYRQWEYNNLFYLPLNVDFSLFDWLEKRLIVYHTITHITIFEIGYNNIKTIDRLTSLTWNSVSTHNDDGRRWDDIVLQSASCFIKVISHKIRDYEGKYWVQFFVIISIFQLKNFVFFLYTNIFQCYWQ